MYTYVLSLLLSSLRSGGSDLRRRAASLDQQEVTLLVVIYAKSNDIQIESRKLNSSSVFAKIVLFFFKVRFAAILCKVYFSHDLLLCYLKSSSSLCHLVRPL